MGCPVCGGVLKGHVSGCSTCPMHGGCDMLCCENCGYETVAPRSATVDLFRRIFGRISSGKSATPTASHD